MSANQPRRYQIPTHLGTPDKIDLPLFGITVSLTLRQGVCFLLGGSLIFHLWEQSFGLVGVGGWLVHWGVPCVLASLTYVLAVHEIRGRHLEDWALVLLHYWGRPKVFVWANVLEENTIAQMSEATEEHVMTAMNDEEEQ